MSLIASMIWTGIFSSVASALDGNCTASVFKTTQDLVYCVTKGINYDKTRRPKTVFPRDDAVVVNVSIEIASLQVDTDDMDFSLQFFFRQQWRDPNLAYAEGQADGKPFIVFKVDLVKHLWTPDTYIYGIRSIQTVQTNSAVPASEGLRISPNGDVLFSTRLSMTIYCTMVFHYFPMDRQKCFLNLTSWSYGRLTITFEFKRRINFYLISWYVPATLIVALSWVGFWIEYKSTPARISLGTITILAMGSFLIGGQEGFPQVSYIRAIDIYLITCFVFVFGCTAEYAILHYTTRRLEEEEHRRNKKHEVNGSIPAEFAYHEDKNVDNSQINKGFIEILTPVPLEQEIVRWNNVMSQWCDNEASGGTSAGRRKTKNVPKSTAKSHFARNEFLFYWASKLDEICRLAFPITFMLFVIAYYIVFVILQ
ncbi:gamma-aminobutyric acid receptor subunit rho-2-like isoform X2 [Acropora palmata]|uniref:gamma-aminobutyric acid receptor subunit rho-2-like isoform X2 n=1 Tax=Acropora palmata TaxID=6131 RepID=UPI003D9FCD1D